MGVDLRLYLPPTARIEDVATVAAILMGCEYSYRKPFDAAREGSRVVELAKKAVVYEQSSVYPAMNVITFNAPKGKTLIDGITSHFGYWHWEPDRAPFGYRHLSLKSTAFWIAVAKGVADFFGGMVDFDDCDETAIDYIVPEQNNWHSDGDAFYDYNERICNVQPLTIADLHKADEQAAYKGAFVGSKVLN